MKRTVGMSNAFLQVAATPLIIISLLCVTPAQTAQDSKEALFAAGMKEFEAAALLARKSDEASSTAAIERLDKAIDLFVKADSSVGQAGTLMLRGACKERLDRYDDAIADLQKALAIYESAGLLNSQAMALNILGGLLLKKNEAPKARDSLERAWELIQKQPFQSADLAILNNLGNAYIALNERKKATDALWKAYELARDRTVEESIATLKNYADAQIQLETPKFALSYYESALKRARTAKLKAAEANLMNSIGNLYLNHLNEFAKAKEYLEQALIANEGVDNEPLRSVVLFNLGLHSYLSIRMQEALEYFERSKAIAIRLNNRNYLANLALAIGRVHSFLNDDKRAVLYFEEAKTLARAVGNRRTEAEALINHAKAQEGAGGTAAVAAADFARAVELGKQGFPGLQRFVLTALFELGTISYRAGDRKKAMEMHTLALDKARQLDDRATETALINNIAKIHEVNGDPAKAIELYNTSLSMSRSLGTRYSEAKTLENLLGVWSKLGNRNFAAFYGKNAINIYQDFRKGMSGMSPDEQRSFMKNVEAAYRKLAAVLVEQGRIAEAEQVLVMLKQEELIDYVRRDDGVASAMLATMALTEDERAALSRYQTIAEQISALGKEFTDLETERKAYASDAFPKQKRYDELKQQLADATLVFAKFLEELKIKFGQQDTRVAQVDSSLKKTLERLKENRTAVVSTIVGEDALNIIVTTSRTQRAHTIKRSATAINELVAKLREALTAPQYDPRPLSQQLYDLMVKPIEGDLSGIDADTIVWSLDGTLRYIPPAVLWDKKKGYLAERYSNVIVNLASRDTIALPVHQGNELSVLGVGVSKPTDGFSALAAVPDELDCIVSDRSAGLLSANPTCETGVLNGRKLIDDKFTLANFQSELGRYPIVHIASHFKLTPGDEKNSFLLLGGGVDRRFTVEKLRNESLTDVELIVLSACNTATPGGAKANGVEIEGFGSIAQREGAKAVMATLWPVADVSTKDFMVEFYRLYGKEGRSKAEAARRAQLRLLNGSYKSAEGVRHRAEAFTIVGKADLPKFTPDPKAPYAHPFYWSPFILSGNWR